MLDRWTELPAWLRVCLGVVVMLAGGVVVWAGVTGRILGGRRLVYTIGLALIGMGFGMILVGGKSETERKGYRF